MASLEALPLAHVDFCSSTRNESNSETECRCPSSPKESIEFRRERQGGPSVKFTEPAANELEQSTPTPYAAEAFVTR